MSTVAACVAAVAALATLVFARMTVRESATTLAEDRLARAEEAKEKHRLRVQTIGDLVEEIRASAQSELPGPRDNPPVAVLPWRINCQRLSRAVVGLGDRLPACMNLWTAHDAVEAFQMSSDARSEIEAELLRVHNDQTI